MKLLLFCTKLNVYCDMTGDISTSYLGTMDITRENTFWSNNKLCALIKGTMVILLTGINPATFWLS